MNPYDLETDEARRLTQPGPQPQKRTELLVLAGRGVRVGVCGHYGLFTQTPDLDTAIKIARDRLADGYARAFVAFRIDADLVDGIGDGTEREMARFEVFPDRVALVPNDQGGLSDEQKAKIFKLPKTRWHGRSLL